MKLKDFDFRLKSPWPTLTRRDTQIDEILMSWVFVGLSVALTILVGMGLTEFHQLILKALKHNDILGLVTIVFGGLIIAAAWVFAIRTVGGMLMETYFYNTKNVVRLKNLWYCFIGTNVRIKERLDEDEIDLPDWRYHYDGYYTITFLFKNDAVIFKLTY